MAMDMGNEIDTQNRQLDRINAKVMLYHVTLSSPKIASHPGEILLVISC